jgi:hypothetical protein
MKTKITRFGASALVMGVMAAGAGCGGMVADPQGDGPRADIRATAQGNTALPVVDVAGSPQFTTMGGVAPSAGARTIPTFTYNATDPTNGVTYPISIVGGNPADNTTTTIPVVIIPLRMTFDDGGVLDGANRAAATAASPIFTDSTYDPAMAGGDVGQYGDVFMRAQANKIGSGYHVKLGTPTTLPTVTINVPKKQGNAYVNGRGVVYGLVDIGWFSAQLQGLMSAMQIAPETVPVFLTDNVMLDINHDPANCCVIGYHGAAHPTGMGMGSTNANGPAPVNTFIYAAYTTPNTFNPAGAPGLQDIHALSHEVAEWLDDPFTVNAVQPWLTPTAPQYGCTPVLETGDPVVGIWFPLAGNPDTNPLANGVWHPEDEVFAQWFLRESPSSAFNGNYTFMGPYNPFPGFHTVATGCN